jgi:hypothetical protein
VQIAILPLVAFEKKTISVGQLMLDTENPRHGTVGSQREAIQALIETQRQKLVVLAADILEHGLSPIDRLLVISSGRRFTVVEGNRRLATVRILSNPALAVGTSIESQMNRLAVDASIPIEADCAVAPNRKEAEHWMEIRHAGGSGGAGVVPWTALAANRFSQKPGREAGAAIRFLEEIERAYPENAVIQDLIREVANKRLTTLGRLVLDSTFKERAGMDDSDGNLTFHFAAADLEEFFERILGDFAANLGVSQVRKKPERKAYLADTPKPDAKARKSEPAPLSPSPEKKDKPKRKRPKPAPKPPKPLEGLDLSNMDAKTQAVLRELGLLKVEKTPHAAAVLIRAILELSVDRFIEVKKLKPRNKELPQRLKKCLGKLDPSQDDQRFSGVRTGLQDGTSLYSVKTLHSFVHNPYFHADALTLNNIAASIEPFLQALNDDVESS